MLGNKTRWPCSGQMDRGQILTKPIQLLESKWVKQKLEWATYKSMLVWDVVGQLEFVKGDHFLHPLFSGGWRIRMDVHPLWHFRVSLEKYIQVISNDNVSGSVRQSCLCTFVRPMLCTTDLRYECLFSLSCFEPCCMEYVQSKVSMFFSNNVFFFLWAWPN